MNNEVKTGSVHLNQSSIRNGFTIETVRHMVSSLYESFKPDYQHSDLIIQTAIPKHVVSFHMGEMGLTRDTMEKMINKISFLEFRPTICVENHRPD